MCRLSWSESSLLYRKTSYIWKSPSGGDQWKVRPLVVVVLMERSVTVAGPDGQKDKGRPEELSSDLFSETQDL